MTGRINRCSHCGCDEPILGLDDKLYCNNCGMILENKVNKGGKPYAWLKYSEPYYIPSASEKGLCRTRYYNNDAIDDRMKERGLVFKTEEEAIKCAKKMLEIVK